MLKKQINWTKIIKTESRLRYPFELLYLQSNVYTVAYIAVANLVPLGIADCC